MTASALSAHERDVMQRSTDYVMHVLRDGASADEKQAAQDFLHRARRSRQRPIPFPNPLCEGSARGDERAKQGANGAASTGGDGSGHGSFCGGPDAGSTAAIPGQLVDQEVTEQGTDTHGE